jgi:hypothetical protein
MESIYLKLYANGRTKLEGHKSHLKLQRNINVKAENGPRGEKIYHK